MSEEVQPEAGGDNEGAPKGEAHVHHKIRLPDTRISKTHHVAIYAEHGDADVYITVGYYDSGLPGEIFLHIGKAGSTLRGALDSWARMVSVGLQWGVPMEDVIEKFKGTSFEPSGATSNKDIPRCLSPIDYAMRWIEGTMASAEV